MVDRSPTHRTAHTRKAGGKADVSIKHDSKLCFRSINQECDLVQTRLTRRMNMTTTMLRIVGIYGTLSLRLIKSLVCVYVLAELQWEQCIQNERAFNLYFGILKLSHIYTMTLEVVFHHEPVHLQTIVDQQNIDGYELLVTELTQKSSSKRISFEVEIIISPDSIPGPFHRTFLLKEISPSDRAPVTVNVRGKILRQGQGTATLRDGVHLKSIIMEKKDDE